MKWVWIILVVVGVLVAIPVLLALVGMFISRGHVASRAVHLKVAPEQVWAVVSDFATWPTWNRGVQRMERWADREGHPVWVVHQRSGPLPCEVIEFTAPSRIVTRIADSNLPFGGTWTWEIAAAPGGSTVRITENGEIYNPIFRTLARFVFGYHGTIEAYLKALSRNFGESVRPQG